MRCHTLSLSPPTPTGQISHLSSGKLTKPDAGTDPRAPPGSDLEEMFLFGGVEDTCMPAASLTHLGCDVGQSNWLNKRAQKRQETARFSSFLSPSTCLHSLLLLIHFPI